MVRLNKLTLALAPPLAMAKLEPPAVALLRDCTETAAALERLESAGELMSATRLAAFALPRREAVWWASMCATHTAPEDQRAIEIRARDTAEKWVRQQDDSSRREAMELARQAGFNVPEAWVAVAAFWSGDSMAPPGEAAVPPAPHLLGTAVAGAVALAAVRGDATRQADRLRSFLYSLRDIAEGGAGRLASEQKS